MDMIQGFFSPIVKKAKYQIIKLVMEITAPIKIYPVEYGYT